MRVASLPRPNRGFTLIELLVTVAVMAVLAVLAVPSMRSSAASQNLNGAYRDLTQVFADARSQAVARRRPVTVTLATVPATTPTANTATSFNWAPATGTKLIASSGTPVTAFTFGPTGTLTTPTTDSTLVVCSEVLKKTRSVTVMAAGSLLPQPDGEVTSC